MHKLILKRHIEMYGYSGYEIVKHCSWVGQDDYKELAVFRDYGEALQFAKRKSHELGLELIDKISPEEKPRKKKK